MKKQVVILQLGLMVLGFGVTARLGAEPFTVLHSFIATPDGANLGGLVVNGGTLFGTTLAGGSAGSGTVYACSTNGSGLTRLHLFTNSPDGAEPHELLLHNDSLYGMTRSGGLYGWGTVFKLNTNGTGHEVLHSFTNLPDGGSPLGGLVADGNMLYGTTALGGSGGNGLVFRMDTNGADYTMLHVFTNTPDGANPYASLVLSGTNLYGTTYNGGLNGRGTVFKLATNGSDFSVIYNFSNLPDAAFPHGKLLVISNVLYGTSSAGGSSGFGGTIFKLNVNGTGYAILHNFTGPTTPASNSDGASPNASLLYHAGMCYGDTSGGGSGDGGTIFQMNLDGTGFAVLKHLTNATDGSIPQAALVFNDNGNTLFGTTYFGPDTGGGTLFSLLLAPTISMQPQNVAVTSGDPATFTVTANGQNPLAYQWYCNSNTGNPNLVGSSLAGQTNLTLTLATSTSSGGYYSVIVTNALGVVTSTPALLTISSLPSITLQPLGATITNGDPVLFTAAATGPGVLSYQWLFQTNILIPGATDTTLAITNANQAGNYALKVTNSFGAVTSSVALLTVVGQPHMLSAQFIPESGSYVLSYVNLAGSTNRLWAATNIAATNLWLVIATNTMATNALWFFTDMNTAKTNQARFYRFSTP